ncbi:hypothetical protein LTR86_005802 [Recurvomyces mirabilis]|nr:hypothetical protein LTR86_005802 [Recurvomyces mirabilis]
MSLQTTCSLFWVDVHDNVVEVDHDTAVCDSTSTSCTITGSHGGTLQATCDSKQYYPSTTSSYYSSYFCACGGKSASIPSGVTCSPACYQLTTSFPTCNLVWVYNGFTSGSASDGITQDTCEAFTCDSNGVECTESTKTLLYQCDNQEHQSQVASDSTHSYICNCHAAAQIPQLYQGASGVSTGSGCSGSGGAASGPGSSIATIQTSGGTSTAAKPSTATTPPPTSTSPLSSPAPVQTTTSSPAPVSTSQSSNSGSQGSASTRLTIHRSLLVSLCASVLLKLLYI